MGGIGAGRHGIVNFRGLQKYGESPSGRSGLAFNNAHEFHELS
jgi:hypothetical protein